MTSIPVTPRLDRGVQNNGCDLGGAAMSSTLATPRLDPMHRTGGIQRYTDFRLQLDAAVEPRHDLECIFLCRRAAVIPFCCRYLLLLVLLFAVPSAHAASLTVLTQNLDRLFDDVDDGYDEPVPSSVRYAARIRLAADKIGNEFDLPQIVALQEVENRNVLERLAAALHEGFGVKYRAVLLPGQDPSGIDVGFLLQADLDIGAYGQLFRERELPYDGSPLFTRPPLFVETCYRGNCLTLLNLHLRSMRGIGGARGERVRQKRLLQAEAIAAWCDRLQRERPDTRLVLLGDLNALTPPDAHVDVVGIIRGAPDNSGVALRGRDLLDPDLIDLTLTIPLDERFSYRFRQRNQQLDYLFVNRAFDARLTDIAFGEIDRSVSDHAGLLARFDW